MFIFARAVRTEPDPPVAGVFIMTPGRVYLCIPNMEHVKKTAEQAAARPGRRRLGVPRGR